VLQSRGDLDFSEESLGPEHVCQLRPKDLDGNDTGVPEVAGEINGRHPATTELPLDVVSAGKRRGNLNQWIRHRSQDVPGTMFLLIRNRFSGSHLLLTSRSRPPRPSSRSTV
jgi:hypothetical protein